MITSSVPTASVRVKAKPSVLWKLTDSSIRLTVNVSQITEASEYTLAYTAVLPSGVSQNDVQFVSGQSGNVTFTVSRFVSREVEIRGKFTGTVAEGYLAGDEDEFIFAPKKLTISGQANLVNQVDHVLVSVGGENHNKNISGSYPYQLIGVSGEPLTDLAVECSEETIYVTYPIYATATIMLDVHFVTGGGISEEDIYYTLSSDHITVAGTEEAIAAVAGQTITLATINLGDIEEDTNLTFAIPLADELINLSGRTEVDVTIDLPADLTTRTLLVTEFGFLGVPDGWTAAAITQVLPIEVRGRASLVNLLTADSVRVVADLKDIPQVAGQYTVPARVFLNSTGSANDIGIMGTEFKVTITLSEGTPTVLPEGVSEGQE